MCIALNDTLLNPLFLCFERCFDDPVLMRFPSHKYFTRFFGQHQCNSLCVWGIFFIVTREQQQLSGIKSFQSSLDLMRFTYSEHRQVVSFHFWSYLNIFLPSQTFSRYCLYICYLLLWLLEWASASWLGFSPCDVIWSFSSQESLGGLSGFSWLTLLASLFSFG